MSEPHTCVECGDAFQPTEKQTRLCEWCRWAELFAEEDAAEERAQNGQFGAGA